MRDTLDAKIKVLSNTLVEMCTKVEENIEKSLKALVTQNAELAQEVIDFDGEINAYETSIEMSCVNLIATQTPLAVDLRRVFSIIKIVTDLERIGDHCVNISKVVLTLGACDLNGALEEISSMGDMVKRMVKHSIKSFVEESVDLAELTAKEDDIVDQSYEALYRNLLKQIKKDISNENQIIGLLLVGRYLERMADHSTNICERLIYLETGKNVKY
ncbi:MAG: phosphate signaling complex protein PhoU [Clostridia bacterium]|nr:phosphate signaling complex protein PhoU [Clostridia bacterium]